MADKTLDQLPEESAEDADILYIRRDGLDYRTSRASVVANRVPAERRVNTGPGLKGGGGLQADVTLDLDIPSLLEDAAPNATSDYVVTHDASDNLPKRVRLDRLPGGVSTTPVSNGFANILIPDQGTVAADSPGDTVSLISGSNIAITADATNDAITVSAINVVPTARNVSAGAGLIGGGSLAADRALAVSIATQSEDTSPDPSADFVMTHDSSTGSLRKVRLSLLASTAIAPSIATPASLGVIRIGPGLTVDPGTGIVSATTSYTLPAATGGTLGGVTVGAGLSVDASGRLSNLNPTPYLPLVATVGQPGVVKPGPSLTVALDGTLDVVGGGGGGGGAADGAYRPESYGAIRGVGLSLAQRQANTVAINACWSAAGGAKGRADMGGGVFEIFGPLTVTQSGYVISGDRCVIRQFQTGVSVVAVSSVSRLSFRGFHLTYSAPQTVGENPTTQDSYAAALRLASVSDSNFEDIETSNAWVGIGVGGTTGSFNNTFTHARIALAAGLGYGLVHKTSTGSAFINVRITSATDALVAVGGGVHLSGMSQTHFTQLTVEHLTCQRPLAMIGCQSLTFSGTVFHDLSPTPIAGYAGLIHGVTGTGAQFAGSIVSNTRLDNTGLGVTDAAIYIGEAGFSVLATNLWVTNTTKVGAVRFSLLGHTSGLEARNLTGTFQQVRLDTRSDSPHRLDDLCYAQVDPLSDTLDGPLLSFNNAFGDAAGGYTTYRDDLSIIYPVVHGRYIRITEPLTSDISVTLAQYIDKPYAESSLNAPRLYRGTVIRVERAATATGEFLATVTGHNGVAIAPLTAGTAADFVFNGTSFELAGGTLGNSSGGGGGGAFATRTEAEAGLSGTTYMSPLRTHDAIRSYASGNEISGVEGDVVGFNAAGDAVITKNTRTMLIPVVGETTALAVGVGQRRIRLPIGLRLKSVEFYLPTPGTSSTTVDINLNGSSIFSVPPAIASNQTTATAATFSTATLAKGGVLTIDVDGAGSGARGLQVALLGTEI